MSDLVLLPPLVPVVYGDEGTYPNAAAVYVASLASAKSRTTMTWALGHAVEILGEPASAWSSYSWATISSATLTGLRTRLADGSIEPASANLVRQAVRGTLRAAWRQGQLDHDMLDRLYDSFGPVRGERVPKGRALSLAQQRQLLMAAAESPGLWGPRDLALLAAMLGAGLRREEAGRLALGAWNTDAFEGQGVLTTLGKGNKEAEQPAPLGMKVALDAWVAVRGQDPGPLFPAITPSGAHWLPRHLSSQGVYKVLDSVSQRAGIGRVSPHDLRRTYATSLLNGGVDLRIVQQLMRHAKLETTARYDMRGMKERAEAASTLSVPVPAPAKR